MRDCILHVGLPKTGTTSIQSSLFRGLRDPRFRLISLDTFFGNRMVTAAFAERFGSGGLYFSHGVTPRMAEREPIRARGYLDRALRAAADRGVTPIVSAEMMGVLPDEPLARLRDFFVERGWSPRVIAYARAPLDMLESGYQQRFRTGDPRARFAVLRTNLERANQLVPFGRLDRTFGADSVTIRWFDPASFPDRCVVRDFCATAGVSFDARAVSRENDSLNLPAVRFLHALIFSGFGRPTGLPGRLAWRVRLDRLRELPGPPLRLHASLTAPLLERIRAGWSAFEERLGRPLPFTLYERDPESGIRTEEDLFDFSAESLEWLARTSGQRVVRRGEGDATVRGVVAQLRRITPVREPILTGRVAAAGVRDVCRREWLAFRNTR